MAGWWVLFLILLSSTPVFVKQDGRAARENLRVKQEKGFTKEQRFQNCRLVGQQDEAGSIETGLKSKARRSALHHNRSCVFLFT